MPSQNNRRTIATAVVVVLVLLIIAALLVLLSPEKPKGTVVTANNAEIPATRPTTRKIVLDDVRETLVEQLTRIPAQRPRAILQTIPALNYDAKDGGQDNFDHIGHWDPLTWVRYNGVDFGKGVSSVTAVVSCGSEYQGRVLYFHIDSHDGPVVAELTVPATKGFEAVSAPVKEVTGVHDVFVTCSDGGFNLQSFKFIRARKATEPIPAVSYAAFEGIQEHNGVVGHTDGGDWLKYDQIDFETGVSFVAVDLAIGEREAKVKFHLDRVDGPVIAELIPVSTGGWNIFQVQETPVNADAKTVGIHDLYITFHGARGLPDLRTIQFRPQAK
jgi:hypothetical protein